MNVKIDCTGTADNPMTILCGADALKCELYCVGDHACGSDGMKLISYTNTDIYCQDGVKACENLGIFFFLTFFLVPFFLFVCVCVSVCV